MPLAGDWRVTANSTPVPHGWHHAPPCSVQRACGHASARRLRRQGLRLLPPHHPPLAVGTCCEMISATRAGILQLADHQDSKPSHVARLNADTLASLPAASTPDRGFSHTRLTPKLSPSTPTSLLSKPRSMTVCSAHGRGVSARTSTPLHGLCLRQACYSLTLIWTHRHGRLDHESPPSFRRPPCPLSCPFFNPP